MVWQTRHSILEHLRENCIVAHGQLNHSLDIYMKVGIQELGIEDSVQFSTVYSTAILYIVCIMILYILHVVCSIYFSIAI